MRLLLDTQALLWTVWGRELPAASKALYGDIGNEVLVSAASYWEISIKISLGKLDLQLDELDAELDLNRIGWLPIERAHGRQASRLPMHHRDPFDRFLVAQALVENLTIVSGDSAFDAYGARRVW